MMVWGGGGLSGDIVTWRWCTWEVITTDPLCHDSTYLELFTQWDNTKQYRDGQVLLSESCALSLCDPG